MTHHLILIREFDEQESGCGRMGGDAARWMHPGSGRFRVQRRGIMDAVGAVYRAVRQAFGEEVAITVVDPRNQISLVPLVLRDAIRYRVPALTALRAVLAAGVSTGIFDGQLLFGGTVPPPAEVIEQIRGRMRVHRVGAALSAEQRSSDDG
jgi:hypothetical protein